ncbi:nicotinate-nucleotide adenylyltransferase [Neptunomonas antarctica]|uniref:Probable nicotinate-nucleotide adenylyltransferase n=1 Tax=Neptunomonas antarctica TaxID=619304 RepID=A0A1N7J7A6_9GAMM|nr:nicotinate-nucleotide adenylyltransferase [Neptunomonas antarctica]SIS45243.1 nicotinate-nucleotide adenylyltransferase [Neptunomonas antarctica]
MVIPVNKLINKAHVFMGGTFDPIHYGHLRTALEIQQWLDVESVYLMPANVPVHRETPGSTSAARLAMIERAISGENTLRCDPREILSDRPSFTIYTLEALRKELGSEIPVCMVIGMDSFLTLDQWYRFDEYLSKCHIIVAARPGYHFKPNQKLQQLLTEHQVSEKSDVLTQAAGGILLHELTPLSISATHIRELLSNGLSPRYLLPDSVWDYIQQNKLYGSNEG